MTAVANNEWKSPWRIEQERRRVEDRLFEEQRRAASIPLMPKPEKKKRIRKKVPRPVRRGCKTCGKLLNRQNQSGYCAPCGQHAHYIERKGERPKCEHPGCTRFINRGNTFKRCAEHANAFHKRVSVARLQAKRRAAA